MKEKNKKILDEAIRNLPDYEPKAGLWEKLQDNLQNPTQQTLADAIDQLPQYEPSDKVWDGIEASLPATTKVVAINRRKWLSLAASLLVLIIAGGVWWSQQEMAADNVSVAHHTETIDHVLLIQDWDDDEEVFQMINEICDVRKLACSNPEIKELQSILTELNDARNELKLAIGAFGTDPDLIQELTDIEMERTSITKEILDKIA